MKRPGAGVAWSWVCGAENAAVRPAMASALSRSDERIETVMNREDEPTWLAKG